MMQTCLSTFKFFYDDKLKSNLSYTVLCEDSEMTNEILKGNDFNTLWDLLKEINFRNILFFETKKGRIIDDCNKFFGAIYERKNNCKPWRIEISTEEISVNMNQLMYFDSEKVIKYLKDRNMFMCKEMLKS